MANDFDSRDWRRFMKDNYEKRQQRKEFDDIVLTYPDDYIEVSQALCPGCGQQLWGDVETYMGQNVHVFVCFDCKVNFFFNDELERIAATRENLTCSDV